MLLVQNIHAGSVTDQNKLFSDPDPAVELCVDPDPASNKQNFSRKKNKYP